MPQRPYVICHMIATIDGKILTRRWQHLSVTESARGLYESTAAEFETGSWLVGTKTMQEFFNGTKQLKEPKEQVPHGDFIANAKAQNFAIATDTNGRIRFDENEVGGDHLIILITEKVGDAYRAHLRGLGISYLVCGREDIDLVEALEKLYRRFGIKKLLLEGGGLINGAMLHAGLIDEISQLVIPIVDGGGADVSGLYDMPKKAGKKAAYALRLIEQRTLKHGTQWLRYRVKL